MSAGPAPATGSLSVTAPAQPDELTQALAEVDPDTLSPKEALLVLYELKAAASRHEDHSG